MGESQRICVSDRLFLCATGSHYLSRAPLQRTKDGRAYCGRCSSEEAIFRDLILERAFQYFKFPCIYPHCRTFTCFELVHLHEKECEFRLFKCYFECGWTGLFQDIARHILETHLRITSKVIEIVVNQSKRWTSFAVLISEMKYFVSYSYDSRTKKLTYNVVLLERGIDNSTYCGVYVSDKNQVENKFQKKNGLCQTYLNWDEQIRATEVIDLSCLVELWDNPEILMVLLEPLVSSDTTPQAVTLGIFNSSKCAICQHLVVMGDRVLCNDCSANNRRALGEKESNVCRWPDCGRIFDDNITAHQRICKHRRYICPVVNCTSTFTYDKAEQHLTEHGVQIVSNIEEKMFLERESSEYVAVLIDNEIILFQIQWGSGTIDVKTITSADEDRFSIEIMLTAGESRPLTINSNISTTIPDVSSSGNFEGYIKIKKLTN